MAAAFGLGSYLDPRDSDVPGNAAMVVAFDTGVAVVAGLVLFPALFAFGMDPDQLFHGAGLLFVTMTVAVSLVLLGAFGVGTGNPVVFLGWSSVVIALHVVLFLRRAPG